MRYVALSLAMIGLAGCASLTNDAFVPMAISFSDGSSGTCQLTNKRMSIFKYGFNLDRNKNLGVELYRFLNDHRVGIQSGEPVMSIQKNIGG